jgi:hypothetical protein
MATKKELYQLTKEMLFAKFDGLCAFCGFELGDRWHIWHIEPSKTIVTHKGEIILGNDSYENKLPACISCNSTRIHNSHCKDAKINIEQFRQALYREFEFMRFHSMTATYYKRAIKYGLLEETGKEILFHFEKSLTPTQ